MNVPDNKKISIIILPLSDKNVLINSKPIVEKLCNAKSVEILNNYQNENATKIIFSNCEVYLPTEDMIDFEKEKARLEKALGKTRQQILIASQMLNNEKFRQNAPEKAKELEQKLQKNKELEKNILNSLNTLNFKQ